jgi:cell division protein FtsB
VSKSKYINTGKSKIHTVIGVFLALLLIFSIVYFLWSLMQYNETMDKKEENEAYIAELKDDIQRLQYMVDAPLDDEFKIRIAREKLGMCFPDEIIYYGEYD